MLRLVTYAGLLREQRDAKGALSLMKYDEMSRQTHGWARNNSSESVTLRQRMIFGDDPTNGPTNPKTNNHNGRLYEHYDEAGKIRLLSYDFKGILLEKERKYIADTELATVLNNNQNTFVVDWTTGNAPTLDSDHYDTAMKYDGLNRMRKLELPQNVDGAQRELMPTYNRAGALKGVSLDGDVYVEHISYNAAGKRLLMAAGNGQLTRYAYDAYTMMLLRVRNEKFSKDTSDTEKTVYNIVNNKQQDISYIFDLSGNIRTKFNLKSGSGVNGGSTMRNNYTYDAIYRLLTATGREHTTSDPLAPFQTHLTPDDNTQTQAYNRSYRYDPLGNLQEVIHTANKGTKRAPRNVHWLSKATNRMKHRFLFLVKRGAPTPLLLALFALLLPQLGAAQWTYTPLEDAAGSALLKIRFSPDKQTGLAIGEFGTAMRSTNAGQSWSALPLGTDLRLNNLHWHSNQEVLVVGDNGLVRWSSDGGQTFSSHPTGLPYDLYACWAFSATHWQVAGETGHHYETFDGGQSWQAVPTIADNNINALGFRPDGTGLATGDPAICCGGASLVLNTADGGNLWLANFTNLITVLNTQALPGDSLYLAAGQNGKVLRSTDGAETWQDTSLGPMSLWRMEFWDESNGLLLADGGELFRTTDAGASWQVALLYPGYEVTDLAMLDSSRAVVTGLGGQLWYLQRETVSRPEPARRFAAELTVYPNPTTGEVNITGEFRPGQPLQLRVLDLNGRVVQEEELNIPSTHLNLPAGVYIIEVRQGTQLGREKVVLR